LEQFSLRNKLYPYLEIPSELERLPYSWNELRDLAHIDFESSGSFLVKMLF